MRRGPAVALAASLTLAAALPARADHLPLGPVEPSAHEQEGIWLLNLARHDPEAYGDAIGFDLTGVVPRPPLAVNLSLTGSARFHALEMLEHDYFAHTSAVTGDGPNAMAVQNGYDLFGMGLLFDWGADNFIESLAFGLNLMPDFESALEALIVDEGVVPPGHRNHLLAITPGFQDDVEVGFGRATAGAARYYSIHTGYRDLADRFVTGVVYRDLDGDGRYDRGEGLPDVTVDVGGTTTTTLAEGGYALAVPPGDHLASCTGGDFGAPAFAFVSVAENVALDCIQGLSLAEVDFAFQGGGGPALLDIAIENSASGGPAPFTTDVHAGGGAAETFYVWDFGDGTGDLGADVSHTWSDPGLYPVVVRGFDASGSGAALHVIGVDGPEGAGPGTTAPADATLAPARLRAKRNLKKPGKDQVKLSATLEMPAGFVPGGQTVEVAVLGATASFVLDEKGRAKDAAGNKLKLKAKKPFPLAEGTVAKLKIKLKGDLAQALEAAGLRNATEERALSQAPIALLLEELVYRGDADLLVKARAGKKASARLAR